MNDSIDKQSFSHRKVSKFHLPAMKRAVGILGGMVWLAALLFTHNAQATVDVFLDIPGIPGEAKDNTYVNKIDVLAWSFGLAQTNATGRVAFQNISITKWLDKASPALMLRCATGELIEKLTLIVRRPGISGLEYVRITVERAVVSSVSTSGDGSQDRLTETVTFSLNLARIDFSYYPLKADGNQDEAMPFRWDVPKNTQW